MGKVGRKPLYDEWITEDGLLQLEEWARDGYSNAQIADMMGVKRRTLLRWKNELSEINHALKKGRKPIAIKIENAFYRRCQYDEIEETSTELWKDEQGKEHKTIKKVKKIIPPDTTAMIFALKNLKPERFKDKHETLISTTIDQETIKDVEDFINGVDRDTEKNNQ